MKKLFGLVLLLIAASTLTGQVYTEVKTGEYAISTYDLGQTDEVEKAPRRYWTHTGSGSLIADTVFYVASGEAIPNISGVAVNKRPAILFERGGEWDTTITVPRNNVIYASYGTGAKPKIYGSQPITGWTLHGGNIYKATFATAINQLFDDGVRMTNARLTNIGEVSTGKTLAHAGYTWIDSINAGKTEIYLNVPSQATNYFAGSKVVIRTSLFYETEARTVNSSTGFKIVLNSAVTNLKAGEGIVVMGKLAFLDRPGEWAQEGDTVYFWAPNSTTPTNVRGSVIDNGIVLTDRQNVTVKNLHILEQKSNGIYQGGTTTTTGIQIINNVIENQEMYGIYILGSTATNFDISNNIIRNNNANGISMRYVAGSRIAGNTVENIGLFQNWGPAGPDKFGKGSGMMINPAPTAGKNTLEYNVVRKTGYNGILVTGWFSAQYNRVDSTTLSVPDGGGIYTTSSTENADITRNISTNSIGSPAGTTSAQAGTGIYVDEIAKGVRVEYNTVTDNNTGIHFHMPYGQIARNNLLYNNNTQMISNGSFSYARTNPLPYTYGSQASYTRVHRNTFINGANAQNLYRTGTSYSLTPLYIYQDSNRYVNLYPTKNVFQNDTVIAGSNPPANSGKIQYIFTDWRRKRGIDFNPTPALNDSAIGINSQRVVWNETRQPQTWHTNKAINVRDIDGKLVDTAFVLQSFESKYLKGRHLYLVKSEVSQQDTIVAPKTIGTTNVLANRTTTTVRRAIPVTFTENGTIQSVTVNHNAGSGNVILGVYSDVAGSPSALLGVTASTAVTATAGWQTIALTTPVTVTSGQKVWLAYVFQNTPNVSFEATGSAMSAASAATWSSGMPSTFGTSTPANYNFSLYCTYTVE